ncbi:M3 family metallopeptidase [Leeia sp.]|uniref:M3 family metallopeptidase n=1 Tax=Leeia sp. TaxID=2884678 RepID=UPI0035AD9C1D
MNPLLDFADLPRFTTIRPEHVTPAMDTLLADAQQTVDQLLADPQAQGWQAFVEPLDAALEPLSRAWGVVGHLNSVMNTPELREVYEQNLPRLTQFYTALGQNLALFERYKALATSGEYASLNPAQQRLIEHELRDFRLSGAELPDVEKQRFAAIQDELAELSNQFSNHLLDATDAWSRLITDVEELAGIPPEVLAMFQHAAEAEGQTGYRLTLQMPFYLPVMQYADNRALRESVYHAYVTRASEFGPAEWDNQPLIDRLLQLRQEEAQLLGFAHYAELSLATKMAESPAEVAHFLRDLAQRAKPFAAQDMVELRQFAAERLDLHDLQMWDVPYVSEKLRQDRYAFSEQEVRRYLPEHSVLEGLFGLIDRLFAIRVEPAEAEVWHPSVRFFTLRNHAGELVGQFYLDLYARNAKQGGAWMDDARSRSERDGKLQMPVAYLVCNFPAPVGDEPACFSFDEVTTLFHECGHGLHHLLTQVSVRGVSGIHGVEWDAVELPSQFMENFCWEWQVLQPMTHHVDTGEPLPRALFDRMVAARNFQSGMQMVRQLEFSLFDMAIHEGFLPSAGQSVQSLLDQVRQEVAVAIPPAYNRFPNSFSHIFGGGYAAGYYSYKWAEVLSADAFAAFEEEGVLNPVTGQRFRDQILAVGGSRPAMASFVAFRGRAPQVDALLRHNGLQPH